MNKRKVFIPITALMAALLLALVATMTPFVAEPEVAHAQTVSSITVGGKAIEFASGTYAETDPVRVSSGTTSIAVSAGLGAGSRVHSFRYGPNDFTTGTGQTLPISTGTAVTGNSVPLRAAEVTNIAAVVVTGSNPTSATVYQVKVMRVASDAKKDADLSALSVSGQPSGVTIVPDFDKDTTSYTLFVPYDVDDANPNQDADDEITITATRSDNVSQTASAGSVVTITSDKDDDIENGNQVELEEGANRITILVEAANVVKKKTYTLTVTRAAENASDDARLSSLKVGGKTVPAADITLADGDDTEVDYTTKVSFKTDSVQVLAVRKHSGAEVVIRTSETSAAESVSGEIDTDGKISLTAGTAMYIAVQVTAEDGKSANRRNYILQVTRVASDAASDADLSALSFSGIPTGTTIVPGFHKDTKSYTLFVPYDVDGGTPATVNKEITVTPTLSDTSGAAVTIKPDDSNDTDNGHQVELKEGRTDITVTVEAADVVTVKTYTVMVTRAPEAGLDETRLSSLTVDGDPVAGVGDFDGTDELVDHTKNVPTTANRIRVVATPKDSGAKVVIRTGSDASGAVTGTIDPDGRIDLTAGTAMFIAVQVTAADGSTVRNYILQVTRVLATASKVADLTALSISDPTGIDLMPTFDEDKTIYTAFVPYDVDANEGSPTTGTQDEITLEVTPATGATTEVTSNKDDSIGTGNVVELEEGANVITIKVTAADAVTKKTYTLTVTRAAQNASDDASLSSLTVGTEVVSLPLPEFDSNSASTTTYVTGVPNTVNSTQITATPKHSGATAVIRTATSAADAVTGTIDADGAIPLIVGYTNFIAIEVKAEDGKDASSKTYMLQVNRAPASASDDAKLSALTIPPGTLTPDFDPDKVAYTAEVGNAVGSVTVSATGYVDGTNSDNSSTVRIMSDTDDDIGNDSGTGLNVATHSIDLEVGANVITVMVKAADYAAEKTYTVTITRGPSADDATLSSLSLKHLPMEKMAGVAIGLTDMDGAAKTFSPTEVTYYADAGDAATITVIPMTTHPDAVVLSVKHGDTAAMKVGVAAYWDSLGCAAMNALVGAASDSTAYCEPYADLSADEKKVVNAKLANYYSIPLAADATTAVAVMVESEDATKTMTYTVNVKREALSDEKRLRAIYANDEGKIDRAGAVQAIRDHQAGKLTRADAVLVIRIYQSGG